MYAESVHYIAVTTQHMYLATALHYWRKTHRKILQLCESPCNCIIEELEPLLDLQWCLCNVKWC